MYLCESHFCDDSQHNFFSFGWVGILLVFVEPGLEGGRGLTGGVLTSGGKVIPAAIPEKTNKFG